MYSPNIDEPKDPNDEEPTSILRVFGDFNSRVRSSMGGNNPITQPRNMSSSGVLGGHQSASQKLRFEDSAIFETPPLTRASMQGKSRHTSKKREINDPFEGLEKYGINLGNENDENAASKKRRRYPSAEEYDALKLELERMKMNLIQKEGECMEAMASAKKSEAFVRRMELTVKKERMEMESTIEKVKREARFSESKAVGLKADLEKRKRDYIQEKEDEKYTRKEIRDDRERLEDKNVSLSTENNNLQDEIQRLQEIIDSQNMEERSEVLRLKRELNQAQSCLQEEKEKEEINRARIAEAAENKMELDKAKSELVIAKNEIQRLQRELQRNEDATIERQADRQKLSQHSKLIFENDNLKRENKLLNDTAENCALLKQKADDLELKLKKAESDAQDGMLAKEKINYMNSQISKWKQLCLDLLTEEEKSRIDERNVGVEILRQKVAGFQQKDLSNQIEIKTLQASLNEVHTNLLQSKSQAEKHEKENATVKENLNQQTSLIKRFKRKLLLVSKERDSYKGVLDTYEHELTFTGKDFERDKLQALEGTVTSYREIIEDLEKQLANAQGVDHEQLMAGKTSEKEKTVSEEEMMKLKASMSELENQLNTVMAEKENLELELERRAIQGDYNPTDTKVLHFRNNPLQQASEEHSANVAKLQTENESLKTRIRLLEEGQSKDLTLLVGQKMEENVSSQEVQELREQLNSKDLQKQRIVEEFTKSAKRFREVCCQLTGYRIDQLQNHQYRLTPQLTENPTEDNLLFRLEQGGELSMLDTPFSSQLTDLIELHLIRQNSIPVFLAAVIMDHFSRQTFDTFQDSRQETAPSEGPSHYMAPTENPPAFLDAQVEDGANQGEVVEQEESEADAESSVGQEEMSEVGEEEEEMDEESVDNEDEFEDEGQEQDDDDDDIVCID